MGSLTSLLSTGASVSCHEIVVDRSFHRDKKAVEWNHLLLIPSTDVLYDKRSLWSRSQIAVGITKPSFDFI